MALSEFVATSCSPAEDGPWEPPYVVPCFDHEAATTMAPVSAGTLSCGAVRDERRTKLLLWPLVMACDPDMNWEYQLPASGTVACGTVSHGRMVFAAADGKVFVCSAEDLGDVHTVPERHGVSVVAASAVSVLTPDSVAWTVDGCVLIADRRMAQTTLYVPQYVPGTRLPQIRTITGMFAGSAVAWGASDGTVCMCLVNLDMPVRKCEPPLDSAVVKVAASTDDALLVAVAESGQVRIYDSVNGTALRDLGCSREGKEEEEEEEGGGGGGGGGGDGGTCVARACTAAFAPDSCLCVVGYTDGSLEVWDTVHAVCVAGIQAPADVRGADGAQITQLCVIGRTQVASGDAFVWASMSGHASLPVGGYGYVGVAAGTASGAVLFWPWCRGRGMVVQGERSVVAVPHRPSAAVVALYSRANTLMCMWADGHVLFIGPQNLVPTGFARRREPAGDGRAGAGGHEEEGTEGQAGHAGDTDGAGGNGVACSGNSRGPRHAAAWSTVQAAAEDCTEMALATRGSVRAGTTLLLPSTGGGLRIVAAHGGRHLRTVVQHSELLNASAPALVGPGAGNGARLGGSGLASMHGSACGRYLAVFDCAARMFVFDRNEYIGCTALQPQLLREMTCALVGEDEAGITVIIGTCTHMIIVRLRSQSVPKVTSLTVDTAVTSMAQSPAGGTVYGCVDGAVCVSDMCAYAANALADTDDCCDGRGDTALTAAGASCNVLCTLRSAVTTVEACTVGGRPCILAGAANGTIALCSQDRSLSWATTTGGGHIAGLSVCPAACLYAAAADGYVHIGSLTRAGVFFKRLDAVRGRVQSVAFYQTCRRELRLAFAGEHGHVQIWNVQCLASEEADHAEDVKGGRAEGM